ncbi:nucleotidyltransferase family protein [Streptomyces sp. NPDC059564]|uniref:nucleotidyltransferase family protein n=1 Tax=Streptomyces sp. NPDC059564 TaxID=3346865 RepID=UPI0036B24CC2
MDLATLYEALGVPEEAGPAELLFAARQQHYTLPYLVLSAVARHGVEMSDAARGELDRARRRAERYESILAEVSAQVPVRPVKGPLLARYYPDGLLRPQGDLDLLVDNERDLWQVVRLLLADEPLYLGVSVLGAPTRHVVVTMTWTPEDPLLDPELRVEVATAALTGDYRGVPIRPALPDDVLVANLLALGEERFQRPFHARDAIDTHVLGQAQPQLSTAQLVAAVEEYRLAPEVRELVAFTAERVPPGALSGLGEALEAPAARELERRAAHPGPARPTGEVTAAVADGSPLYGMPLRRVAGRTGWDGVRTHLFGDNALLLTPVGDYLLVTDEIVDQERYDAALRELELDRLPEETP